MNVKYLFYVTLDSGEMVTWINLTESVAKAMFKASTEAEGHIKRCGWSPMQ